jgi:hypothetical protein
MNTARILISIPEKLQSRMKAAIPDGQRSPTIARLIEEEVRKREKQIMESILAVENDNVLNKEMEDWDITLSDGLNDEAG